jgi:hypothetical protein
MKTIVITFGLSLSLLIFGLSGCVEEFIWVETGNLMPGDGGNEIGFGSAVSLDGETIIIGAFNDDDNGPDSGSAYIFEKTGGNWIQQTKLLPADGGAEDRFGLSVSVTENTVIVGTPGDDDNGPDSGSAYMFEKTGGNWIQQTKLLPADGEDYEEFGSAVSVDGTIVVIGKHYDSVNGWDSGSAYIFEKTGGNWIQQTKLLPSDGEDYDEFGSAVSISGEIVVIGAFGDDDNGFDSGSAYVFERVGAEWVQSAKFTPSDGSDDDEFGISVSVNGDIALIGSQKFNDESAYLFEKNFI